MTLLTCLPSRSTTEPSCIRSIMEARLKIYIEMSSWAQSLGMSIPPSTARASSAGLVLADVADLLAGCQQLCSYHSLCAVDNLQIVDGGFVSESSSKTKRRVK